MAKKGKKKGKGKEKTPEEEKDYGHTQVAKTFYQLEIDNINSKIDRLESQTKELQKNNNILQEEYNKVEQEKNETILSLKRVLEEKRQEARELQDTISQIKKSKVDNEESFNFKVENINKEYEETRNKLRSQMKSMESKVIELQTFRDERHAIMSKYEGRQKEIETKEKMHSVAVHKMERRFFIEKDLVKKTLETQLINLSTSFHDSTAKRMSDTTLRIIRENIGVNNELDDTVGVHNELYKENEELKTRIHATKILLTAIEADKKNLLRAILINKEIIAQLKNDKTENDKVLEGYKNTTRDMHDTFRKKNALKSTLELGQKKVRLLEQNLESSQCSINSIQTEVSINRLRMHTLNDALLESIGNIRQLSSEIREEKSKDKLVVVAKHEDLIKRLTSMLQKALQYKSIVQLRESLPSIHSVSEVYQKQIHPGLAKEVCAEVRPLCPGRHNIPTQTHVEDGILSTVRFSVVIDTQSLDMVSEVKREREMDQEEVKPAETESMTVVFFEETGSLLAEVEDLNQWELRSAESSNIAIEQLEET